jgi:GT2 family glycosyltransferase
MEKVALIVPNRYPEQWAKWTDNINQFDPGMDFVLRPIFTKDIPEHDVNIGALLNKEIANIDNEYVVFICDDTYPKTNGWLIKLYELIEKYRFATINPWQVTGEWTENNYDKDVLYLCNNNSDVIKFSNFTFCMFLKSTFEKVGGWDEGFKWWYGDNDISRRMESYGDHAYVFRVVCHHEVSATVNKSNDISKYESKMEADRLYYNKKWNENLKSHIKKEA